MITIIVIIIMDFFRIVNYRKSVPMKCNQNIERVLEFIFLVVQTTRKSECKRTDASTEKLDTWHNNKSRNETKETAAAQYF